MILSHSDNELTITESCLAVLITCLKESTFASCSGFSWAERNNLAYSGYIDLAGQDAVYDLIEKAIYEVNKDLSKNKELSASQIRRFLILHKELDADDGELTRTNKVRRGTISDRYNELVKALYNGSKNCHIKTEVVFEDGKKGEISADIKIKDMNTKSYGNEAA